MLLVLSNLKKKKNFLLINFTHMNILFSTNKNKQQFLSNLFQIIRTTLFLIHYVKDLIDIQLYQVLLYTLLDEVEQVELDLVNLLLD